MILVGHSKKLLINFNSFMLTAVRYLQNLPICYSIIFHKLNDRLYEAWFFFWYTGLPHGVVNIVYGVGPKCGAALVEHPDVQIISFTGSTATGKFISERSAPLFKKLSLEVNHDILFVKL